MNMDDKAKMIQDNLGIVVNKCKRFKQVDDNDFEDLFQYVQMRLVIDLDKYDSDIAELSTFIGNYSEYACKRYRREYEGSRVCDNHKDMWNKVYNSELRRDLYSDVYRNSTSSAKLYETISNNIDEYTTTDLMCSLQSLLTDAEYELLQLKMNGYTQTDLSNMYGVHQVTISRKINSIFKTIRENLE